MRHVLLALLLTASVTVVHASDLGTEEQREEGRQLYMKYCSQCHGVNGDGQGYATPRVKPEPRDFTPGKYKFRSTPSGALPTDADLYKVIRDGLPYTSMPGWPNFSDQQIQNLIYHLKTYSDDFSNPDFEIDPIDVPEPPPSSEESIQRGREIYEELGCAACHGHQGRGDGTSAPTLTDDWGNHIWPADLTMRWTFRGGPTRRDVYRTFSTGLNGTPMPSYADSLEDEDRWRLVDYIFSIGDGDEPGYDTLLSVDFVEDEIDLADAQTLFTGAQPARFPLIGQIIEPGRNFMPTVTSVDVRAVYNRKEIAFEVRWHDRRADAGGHNGPGIEVPPWVDPPAAGAGDDGGFFGDAEAEDDGGFFGDAEAEQDDGGFFGDAEAEEGADFFGDAEASEDDFFGGAEDDFFGDDGAAAGGAEFSDAVAIQLPSQLPTGNRKPYFIFGDSVTPIDLWFVDLARGFVEQFIGRGSDSLEFSEADDIQVVTSFDQGEWTATFKRSLRSSSGISLTEGQFVPIGFSVWDGLNEERGNRRALSAWFYFYTEPSQLVSPIRPMLTAALIVLAIELLVIFVIRRRSTQQPTATTGQPAAGVSGGEVAT